MNRLIVDDKVPTIFEERVVKANDEVVVTKYVKRYVLERGSGEGCYEFVNNNTKRTNAATISNKTLFILLRHVYLEYIDTS